jgi:hypothetical protein
MPGKDRMMTLAISVSSVERSRSLRELDGILQRTGPISARQYDEASHAIGVYSIKQQARILLCTTRVSLTTDMQTSRAADQGLAIRDREFDPLAAFAEVVRREPRAFLH